MYQAYQTTPPTVLLVPISLHRISSTEREAYDNRERVRRTLFPDLALGDSSRRPLS